MSTKVRIRVVVTTPAPSVAEFVASEVALTSFAPDLLDRELDQLLLAAARALDNRGLKRADLGSVEVSVQLSSSGESVRPSLHLSPSVVGQLESWGASFGFDPYCD
jgi:hypothetical protein